eukprot:gene4543-5421_t
MRLWLRLPSAAPAPVPDPGLGEWTEALTRRKGARSERRESVAGRRNSPSDVLRRREATQSDAGDAETAKQVNRVEPEDGAGRRRRKVQGDARPTKRRRVSYSERRRVRYSERRR